MWLQRFFRIFHILFITAVVALCVLNETENEIGRGTVADPEPENALVVLNDIPETQVYACLLVAAVPLGWLIWRCDFESDPD